MIRLQGGDATIYILEPGNINRLKKGEPIKLADGKTVLCYTPDPVWLADKLMDCDGDSATVSALIDESLKRPEKPYQDRKPHPNHLHTFGE